MRWHRVSACLAAHALAAPLRDGQWVLVDARGLNLRRYQCGNIEKGMRDNAHYSRPVTRLVSDSH